MMEVTLAIVALVLVMVGSFNVVYALPHLVAVLVLRPMRAGVSIAIISIAVCLAYDAVSSSDRPLAYVALCIALLPYPVYWIVSYWTWLKTDARIRGEALKIREEIADRYEERPPSQDRWYPGVIYDLERSRRREAYEAPATG